MLASMLLTQTAQFDHVVYDAAPHAAPLQSSAPVGLAPAQIRTAYGIDSISLGALVGNGAGQTIAIVDAYDDPNIVGDLQAFDAQFNLPAPPSFTKLNQTGGTTAPAASGSSGWAVEESLDVEWAHSVAPKASIVLLEANSSSNRDLFTAVDTARNLPGVSVVSMSWGSSGDYAGENAADSYFTTPTGRAGVTFVASTGDSGTPGGYPAYSPNVLAVGGTTLQIDANNQYAGESGWSGAGGGQSAIETEPGYQTGVQSSGMRQIPDVSFNADPNSGVAVYDSYDFGRSTPWAQVGGTSLAAPCWAGLIAIADQLRVANGLGTMDGATQTLPALYSISASDFHDITTGNNGLAAGLGYDMVTGLGSPIANRLVPDLVPIGTVANPATTTAIAVSTASSVYGQPITFAATVGINAVGVSPPTGTMTFWDGRDELGAATLSRGMALFTTSGLDVGTHSITAVYGGDSKFARSASGPVAEVVGKASTVTTLSVSAGSIVYGQPETITATVRAAAPSTAGAPSGGTVTFVDQTTGATLGTAVLVAGTASLTVPLLPVGAQFFTASYSGDGTHFLGSSSGSVIATIAGNGFQSFSGDGSPATAAQLSQPDGIAVDASGDVFIADGANCVVREVNASSGRITTIAGNGTGGYSGDGSQATAAELNYPAGLALNGAGDLFIADFNNNVIREVNLVSGVITTVAGDGTAGYSGDRGQATAAELYLPNGVAVDNHGNLFIADYGNNTIRAVNLASGIITTVAGTGVAGYSGDGGQATSAQLSTPGAVIADNRGDLFVADSGNNAIREINLASGVITTIAGAGTAGYSGDGGQATAATLKFPVDLILSTAGDLFIADTNNSAIRAVNLASGAITTVAGNGVQDFSGDGGQATAASLNCPQGVALDGSGHLFIADDGNFTTGVFNNRIREVNLSTGIIQTVAGGGPADNSPAANAAIDLVSVTVDAAGNLYIPDPYAATVREVNVATGLVTTVAGNGGSGDGGNGGQATAAALGTPSSVALDNHGDLFIADSSNDVVREVNLPTGVITTVAGVGAPGYSGDGGQATAAHLDRPMGVAVDSYGNLFISDTANSVVREVNLASGVITTVAGSAFGFGYSGDGGQATAASLTLPYGVAVDNNGNLFIADFGDDAVREVNLESGVITTVAGNGYYGYSGDGGQATAASLARPADVAVSSSGQLFIADSGNSVIRAVDLSSGTITTAAGNGSFGYSGDGGSPLAAALFSPQGVAVDSNGDLFIADTGNNRIRSVMQGVSVNVAPAPTITLVQDSLAAITYGQSETLTAAVGSAIGTPTGTVAFWNGTTLLGTATLSGGTAALTVTSLPAGTDTVSAQYGGDTDHAPSSGTGLIAVAPALLTVTVESTSRAVGAANPVFAVAITGFVNGDSSASGSLSGSPRLICSATPSSLVATYAIIASQGTLSAGNYTFQFVNGTLAVLPPPASGASTLGLFAPAPSAFFLDEQTAAASAIIVFNYGPPGVDWTPIAGDWTGTGTTTIGLYDPATSTFFLHNSNSAGYADNTFSFGWAQAAGVPALIPLSGDWTGNGITSVGLYDPATSTFFLRNSNSAGPADITFSYGPAGAGWIPITGNWTGTSITYVGLYDPAASVFFLRDSNTTGVADATFNYGPAGCGWEPLAGHWTGGGPATVGLYNPATSTFFLRNSNAAGVADATISYGEPGNSLIPLVGNWSGVTSSPGFVPAAAMRSPNAITEIGPMQSPSLDDSLNASTQVATPAASQQTLNPQAVDQADPAMVAEQALSSPAGGAALDSSLDDLASGSLSGTQDIDAVFSS